MDMMSYLIGKKSGGSEPILQEKTETITTNTTTTISPDTGYDGLSSVEVTTNIPVRDWTEIGYTEEPDCIQDFFDYSKEIKRTWNANITNCTSKYAMNNNVVYFPVVDTSKVMTMQSMFEADGGLQVVPKLDTKKVETFYYFCKSCNTLREVGEIEVNLSGSIEFYQAFYACRILETAPMIKVPNGTAKLYGTFQGCTLLKNVPQWDLYGINQMTNTFTNCPNLTSESLNNIMGCIKLSQSFTGTKTLKAIGFTSDQATICEGLSNWSTLQLAGWTTGY